MSTFFSPSVPTAVAASSAVHCFYPLGLRFVSRERAVGTTSTTTAPGSDVAGTAPPPVDDANEYVGRPPDELLRESACVCLDGLVPDFVPLDHLDARLGPLVPPAARIVLRRVRACFATTFNLYVLVFRANLDENVRHVQREISRSLIVSHLRSTSSSTTKTHPGQSYNTPRSGSVSTRLELVMDEVSAPLGSLYDLATVLDDCSTEPSVAGDTTRETDVGPTLTRPCALFVWRFDDDRAFRQTHRHLAENVDHLAHVYNLPSLFDDDVVRFSFDMIVAQREHIRQVERGRIMADLMTKLGKRSEFTASLDALTNKSLVATAGRRAGEKRRLNEELLTEFTLERLDTADAVCDEQISSPTATTAPVHANHGIDLFGAFGFGEWCILRDNLVLRIDRDTFDRVLASTSPTLFAALTIEADPDVAAALWQTPLVFLPNVIWDVETIAANPGTIPRGVSADEKLVSVAVTIDRNALPASLLPPPLPCSVFLFVLVPRPLSDAELLSVEQLDFTPVTASAKMPFSVVDRPTVFCYRDERAMLVDVVAFLSSPTLVYRSALPIVEQQQKRYRNLASLLVGHNTVGYDFLFLHNRARYFSLNAMAAHLSRHVAAANSHHSVAGCGSEISALYTFHDSQLCLDTMLFLMARMRHLPSFDLASVLAVYRCEIRKGSLDAREIRFFYNSLETPDDQARLGYHTEAARIHYFREFLAYNMFDCLSLADLLRKLSFAVFANTLMQYFHAPFNVSCYCGNSRLLPGLIICDMLAHGREFLSLRPRNLSLFAVSAAFPLDRLAAELRRLVRRLNGRRAPRLCLDFLVDAFPGLDVPSLPPPTKRPRLSTSGLVACSRHNVASNPLATQTLMPFVRTLTAGSRLLLQSADSTEQTDSATTAGRTGLSWLRTGSLQQPDAVISKLRASVQLCDLETDLLRVDEKTYIGGLNFADPCHLKNPFLMDYNSFYPSIIRHYQLDFNNVAVFTVAKLLLVTQSVGRLDRLLRARLLRVFDYTSRGELAHFVNEEVFSDERFADVYVPVRYCRREWYDGVELDSVDLLVASTRHFGRRVLVVWSKTLGSLIEDAAGEGGGGSTIARIVSDALVRRAVWKRQRKLRPDDRVLESRELMEKLLANGTYGYLNFSRSVVFSRATAAAVTLLCRNAFARTRFIIESDELMRRFRPHLVGKFRSLVNYIDTDGCIVSFVEQRRPPTRNQPLEGAPSDDDYDWSSTITPLHILGTQNRLLYRLNCAFDPSTVDPTDIVGDTHHHSVRNRQLSLARYRDLNGAMKDQFVELVNEMLDMNHVRLAAEQHHAVAASVFGRKKYTLFNMLDEPAAATAAGDEHVNLDNHFAMKKTGFEKNAPAPIKRIYDRLLRNVMTLNHTQDLNHRQRFICKITDHRAFLYAVFDSLHDQWREALAAARTNVKLLQQFATKIPLNVRTTGGKLALFIEETLRVHQYDPGDRVHVLRLFPVSPNALTARPRLVSPITNLATVVYSVADSRIVLLDEAKDQLDEYFPDLRYFLGGHLTYMYQCVEGCKTLRDRNDLLGCQPQLEPIAWRTTDARDRLFASAFSRMGYSIGDDSRCGAIYVDPADNSNNGEDNGELLLCNDDTICMRSLTAISSLYFTTWLWERVIRPQHVATFGPAVQHALIWREIDADRTRNLLAQSAKLLSNCTIDALGATTDADLPTFQRTSVTCVGQQKRLRFLSPYPILFGDLFAVHWTQPATAEARAAVDRRTRDVLFAESSGELLRDRNRLLNFFADRVVLYRNLY